MLGRVVGMISQEGSRRHDGSYTNIQTEKGVFFSFSPSQLIKARVWWGKAGPWAGRTVASGCFRLNKPNCVMTEGSKKPTSVSGKFPLTPSHLLPVKHVAGKKLTSQWYSWKQLELDFHLTDRKICCCGHKTHFPSTHTQATWTSPPSQENFHRRTPNLSQLTTRYPRHFLTPEPVALRSTQIQSHIINLPSFNIYQSSHSKTSRGPSCLNHTVTSAHQQYTSLNKIHFRLSYLD